MHTGFIDQHYSELFPRRTLSHNVVCQAAVALVSLERIQTWNSALESKGVLMVLNMINIRMKDEISTCKRY